MILRIFKKINGGNWMIYYKEKRSKKKEKRNKNVRRRKKNRKRKSLSSGRKVRKNLPQAGVNHFLKERV